MHSAPKRATRLRKILHPVMQFLRQSRSRLARRFGSRGADRERALTEELQFWENALKDGGRNWAGSEYHTRMDPDLELQDFVKEMIPAPRGEVVRLLDVGAGPLTRLGKQWPGRQLELFPVDPLAFEYRKLLDRLSIRPPVYTLPGHGERLTEQFANNFFDLAYASNSLDHSYDPLKAILQMFEVVKPQRCVYLWHFARAGINERYSGLHQWNFDIANNDLVLSDGRGTTYSLARTFAGRGELSCTREKFERAPVVVGKLKKLQAS